MMLGARTAHPYPTADAKTGPAAPILEDQTIESQTLTRTMIEKRPACHFKPFLSVKSIPIGRPVD
jgi:hypothetical protein